MNKRIQELWYQANIRFANDYQLSGKPREEWRSVPDIFAELLIRECIAQCNDGDSQYFIAKHFGVE